MPLHSSRIHPPITSRWHQALAFIVVLGICIGCERPQALRRPSKDLSTQVGERRDLELPIDQRGFGVARDQITQISIVNALMLGEYDGVTSIAELLRYGDFGVGTLDHLDGELIVLDGQAFQVRGDGSVNKVAPDEITPFAIVTPFDALEELSFTQIESLSALDQRLDDAIGQPNKFLAVRIHGDFSKITLRSVNAQSRPYRPLGEVAKDQSVWTRTNVTGTLIGIRCPAWIKGLNVPGYHWHFLSDQFDIGGHVLECRAGSTTVRYDICNQWMVRLVDAPGFDTADLNKDLNSDLHRVESSRGDAAGATESDK